MGRRAGEVGGCDYFIIQIMSKKAQPQKAEGIKNKAQGLEEENEPFLKTLQKKVRNINKKLADIAELEAKDSLKPEQVEKLNRKQALLDERTRAEETAALFRDTYAENAAHYRNAQLRELEVLARALSLYHSGAKLQDSDRLAALWRVLEQSDKTYPSLNDSIAALSAALKDFANDRKLQKALAAHVEQHGAAEHKAIEINQEKIVSDILEEKPETLPEPLPPAKEEPLPASVPEPTEALPAQPVEQPKVEPAPEVAPVEPVAVTVAVAVEETVTPVVAQETPANPPAPVEGEKKRYNNRDNRDRPYRERREPREGEAPRERKQYKPRYQEKKPEVAEPKRSSSSSSSDSSPEARAFRREEIKKLEEDGFIVISKPKPKAKDPKEVRSAHDKQHGKKYHHHHQQPQN